MQQLPEKVQTTYEELKKNSDRYLSIKIINGHCYVYEATSKWDKEKKKVKGISRYIGRITIEGLFIPGIRRDAELGGALVEREFSAKPRKDAERKEYRHREYPSEHENEIISALSVDGRITLAEMGKKMNIKPATLDAHRKHLERKYGVRYILEPDLGKLGCVEYAIMIKFQDEVPNLKTMKRELEKEPRVQLALLTQGDYDLFIYALFDANGSMREQASELRDRLFPDCNLRLYLAQLTMTYGFVPLRDEFFVVLKEQAVGKGQKDVGGPRLLNREYSVLKDMNSNGNMDFAKMDEKNKFGAGSARYTYNRLVQKGVIRRVTVSLANLPIKYFALILLEDVNHSEFIKCRNALRASIVEGSENPINKYILSGELGMPDGTLLLLPVFTGVDLDKAMEELRAIKGTRVRRLVITNTITGSLCCRRLDATHSLHEDDGMVSIIP